MGIKIEKLDVGEAVIQLHCSKATRDDYDALRKRFTDHGMNFRKFILDATEEMIAQGGRALDAATKSHHNGNGKRQSAE